MTSVVISHFGLSCFLFEVKDHEETSFVTDPFAKTVGLKLPRNLAADFVTVSSDDDLHNNTEAVKPRSEKSKIKIIANPGEYEVKGVFINGFSAITKNKEGKIIHQNTIFNFVVDDIRITHLGALSKSLSDEEMQNLGNADVLLLPISSDPEFKNGPTTKNLIDIVNQIEPRVLIPMHYKISGVKFALNPLDKFLKELGKNKIEPLKKFKFSKKDLPQEEMKVVVLTEE